MAASWSQELEETHALLLTQDISAVCDITKGQLADLCVVAQTFGERGPTKAWVDEHCHLWSVYWRDRLQQMSCTGCTALNRNIDKHCDWVTFFCVFFPTVLSDLTNFSQMYCFTLERNVTLPRPIKSHRLLVRLFSRFQPTARKLLDMSSLSLNYCE